MLFSSIYYLNSNHLLPQNEFDKNSTSQSLMMRNSFHFQGLVQQRTNLKFPSLFHLQFPFFFFIHVKRASPRAVGLIINGPGLQIEPFKLNGSGWPGSA